MHSNAPHRGPCKDCGEVWPGIVSRATGLCPNCAENQPHARRIAHCPICGRSNVPAQLHHVASERHHKTFASYVCLSCHAILTGRQCAAWEPSWKTQDGTLIRVRCIIQGTVDVGWLTWQRSGRQTWRQLWASQLRELFHLLFLALRALAEVFGLVGFAVIGWGTGEATR
jgi:hypothetical protein